MPMLKERDWTQLQPELIHLIAKKLSDVLNFIRFRAVCKTWRSNAPLSDPPTQFPWIYEYPQESDSDSDSEDARARCSLDGLKRFYSISADEIIKINVRPPYITGDWGYCMGIYHDISSVYYRDRDPYCADLYLYNPLTHRHVCKRVPLPLWKPVIVWTTNSIFNQSMLIADYLCSTNNMEESAGLVFLNQHGMSQIVYKELFSGTVFHCQGKIFITYENGYTMVRDLSKKSSHEVPPPDNDIKMKLDVKKNMTLLLKERTYIVESGGIILRVSWFYHRDLKNAKDSIFHIYKLQSDEANRKFWWVRLNNIGNEVLFLERKIAISMSFKSSTGFNEGCIYFLSPNLRKPFVYDVRAGTIEMVPVPSSFKRCTWFVPGLL